MHARWGLLVLAALLAAGCDARPSAGTAAPLPGTPRAIPQGTVSPEEAATSSETPLPEIEQVEPGAVTLRVWVAEGLTPTGDSPGGETLLSQLAAFDEAHPDIRVEVQAKRVSGRGSTLDYLRTAPPVAPSVLPDLALLDNDALLLAAREGLIVPWQALPEEAVTETDLYAAAARLGRVDEVQVGLPYLLEIHHAVYRVSVFEESAPVSYADLLPDDADELPSYVFPAARTGGVNHTTLLQYLAAGGSLIDDEGNPFIDETVLAGVLSFYEQALDKGVLDPAVLQYSTPAETWELYQEGQAGLAEVSSGPYLSVRTKAGDAGLTSVPTAQGEPTALLTGWLWVLVTRDPQRQAAASALVAWLMEPVNHGAYSRAAGYLPSQPDALAVWGDDPYAAFASRLLDAAVPPPDPLVDSVAGVAMQNAVQDVLLGRRTAQEAAADAAAATNSQAG